VWCNEVLSPFLLLLIQRCAALLRVPGKKIPQTFSKVYLSKLLLEQLMLFVFQKHDSNEDLAYWLSNSSTLLIMLQKSLKAAGSTGISPQKRPQTQSSFLGRMVRFINYSWSWLTCSFFLKDMPILLTRINIVILSTFLCKNKRFTLNME
jgi:hypothetical protein